MLYENNVTVRNCSVATINIGNKIVAMVPLLIYTEDETNIITGYSHGIGMTLEYFLMRNHGKTVPELKSKSLGVILITEAMKWAYDLGAIKYLIPQPLPIMIPILESIGFETSDDDDYSYTINLV